MWRRSELSGALRARPGTFDRSEVTAFGEGRGAVTSFPVSFLQTRRKKERGHGTT